jgi:glycosyltransferase involved in cell wall biosynthesis
MKEYELIFVDDCSNDESVNIIKKYMQKDKRIKLIKNTKNRGSLYTRYKGVQHSKGEFIIFVDSDDVVLKEGILRAYNYIKKNNLDIVQFNSVFQKNDTNIYISRRYYKYDSIIYQPILSYIFYYNKNKGNGAESNTALWDKLIKREVVLNTFYFIGNKFIKEKIIIENDVIILFSLFKNAKSFKYIDELGYYYFFTNNDSISNTRDNPLKASLILYSIFSF